MEEEIWKDIPGYEGLYQASTLGRIRSFCYKQAKILKPWLDPDYLIVQLKGKNYKVHRLIALTFIPNPNNYPQINHKDEDRTNNRVNNLEWCTNEYNANYGTRNERIRKILLEKELGNNKKGILQYDLDGVFLREFKSETEALKSLGKLTSRVTSLWQRDSLYGYMWKLKESEEYPLQISPYSKTPNHCKKIFTFNDKNEFLQKYNSIKEASLDLNVSCKTIRTYLQNGNLYKGIKFIYKSTI